MVASARAGGPVTLTPEQIGAIIGLSPGRVIQALGEASIAPVPVKKPGRGRAKFTYRAEDLRPWVEARLKKAEAEADPWRALAVLVKEVSRG